MIQLLRCQRKSRLDRLKFLDSMEGNLNLFLNGELRMFLREVAKFRYFRPNAQPFQAIRLPY